MRLSQLSTLVDMLRKARPVLSDADVVHVHSNTFMNQVSAYLVHRGGGPFILTHYGTEIWHYRRRRPIDPFLWMNQKAAHVTYYSRLLLERSLELGVDPPHRSVVYPPADTRFRPFTIEEREEARRSLNVGSGPLLINVKRLHPLAGQRTLIEAMPEILKRFPDAKAWIAGEGESRAELEALIAEKDLRGSVRLLGLVDNRELPRYYAAADVFVLPSLLEAFPTVAAEALASGTPVVTADHPGGREIKDLFPEDVRVVPKQDAPALARELVDALSLPRRCSGRTLGRIESEFRPEASIEAYLKLYRLADSGEHRA
jgi:glycosyltransferase involved in cell wall biosynthesis